MAERTTPVKPAPVVYDPFSLLRDEIEGETAQKVAKNLLEIVQLRHPLRTKIRHEPPNLKAAFRGYKLSENSKEDLRYCERTLARLWEAEKVSNEHN